MTLLIYWLIAANLLSFILMVWDKSRAERGERRVSERRLGFWMMVGGATGGLIASHLVRHKTRKQPFATMMRSAAVVQWLVLLAMPFGLQDLITQVLGSIA